MNEPKLTAERLTRKALVYIRQSSPNQVLHHHESQRRQYGLGDRAREVGFQQVDIVDEDLGRTGSGLVERPGFQRLVAGGYTERINFQNVHTGPANRLVSGALD